MATTAKSVDASLWWDPFSLLLTDLENASLSSDLPPNLVNPNPLSLARYDCVCAWIEFLCVLFRRRSWRKTEVGSWTQCRASSHRIRNRRRLWIQRQWRLGIANWLSSLNWKKRHCVSAPTWWEFFFLLPIFASHFVVFAKPSLQCYTCCTIESFISLFSMKWIFWGECEFNDIWISWISWCLYDILDIVIDYWFAIGAYCLFQALDEVQTYILVERTLKDKNLGADSIVQEYLHVVSSFFFLYSRCVVCGHHQILVMGA